MAFTPPKKQGIERVSEGESTRILTAQADGEQKTLGKFCDGCNKYFNYLLPEEKYCLTCGSHK